MQQPFDCTCARPSCHGTIAGAKHMSAEALRGVWLAGHIRDLLAARDGKQRLNGTGRADDAIAAGDDDPTHRALHDALVQAERSAAAAREALLLYRRRGGAGRRGPTSRELGGEMGGDTAVCA
jgi:hypothetical protein